MDVSATNRRLDKIKSLIIKLQQQERELEKSITGGDDWGGTFAEVFGSNGPVFWDGAFLVPQSTYKHGSRTVAGGYWASTFGGPDHCHFADGQMPVIMRGSFARLRRKSDPYRDRQTLFRLAKRHHISLTSNDDVRDALIWAERMQTKGKFKDENAPEYFRIIAQTFGNPNGYSDKLKGVLLDGEVISPHYICEKLVSKGANARSNKAYSLSRKIGDMILVQRRRKKTGRHKWALALQDRQDKVEARGRELCKMHILERRSEELYESILIAGKIDWKLRKLVGMS